MALDRGKAVTHAVRVGLGLAVLSRQTLAQDTASEGLAALSVMRFPLSRERAWSLTGHHRRVADPPAARATDEGQVQRYT